jgi:hypothetical protein
MIDALIAAGSTVTCFDNFTSGHGQFLQGGGTQAELRVVRGDLLSPKILPGGSGQRAGSTILGSRIMTAKRRGVKRGTLLVSCLRSSLTFDVGPIHCAAKKCKQGTKQRT